MKSKKSVVVAVLTVGTLVASAAFAQAQYAGAWETDSTACNGRGAGHIRMTIAPQNNALTWSTSTGYTYVCSLNGARCAGTWSGRTGSGWFDVTFNGGASFSGNWGYGDDHSASGSFSGHR